MCIQLHRAVCVRKHCAFCNVVHMVLKSYIMIKCVSLSMDILLLVYITHYCSVFIQKLLWCLLCLLLYFINGSSVHRF